MTMERLLSVILDKAGLHGRMSRDDAKEIYGAGFEGAIKDAVHRGLVESTASGMIGLTSAGKSAVSG